MKKLILTVALSVACVSAFAQGQLNFANFGAGANAPIFDTDGTTKLAGAAFQADLYWGAGTVTDSSLLTALGAPANFASSGYFLGGSRTITGQPGGSTITGQVRVWDTASGSSWAQASTVQGAKVGESVLFSIALTAPPTTPNTLTGLNGNSFSLRVVNIPEPSTLALAGIGLAGMLVLRRRK
jgi:hypothetical protein